MSFHNLRKPRQKSARRKTPEWDDTVNDLKVYQATPEELEYRKRVHQSKNINVVQSEKTQRYISKALRAAKASPAGRLSAYSGGNAALMKEVLHDQSQLEKVLSQSDRALSVVKDIFGDDPKRYRGFPAVTVAPRSVDVAVNNDQSIMLGPAELPSRLDILSDSMMDSSALNEVPAPSSSEDESPSGFPEDTPVSYQPAIDMSRFQRLLQEHKQDAHKDKQNPLHVQTLQTDLDVCSNADGSYMDENRPYPGTAINDTGKVKRTKPRQIGLSGDDPSNLSHLKQVLGIQQRTGGEPPGNESFSGYTQALLESINKLSAQFLKSEQKRQASSLIQEQLMQDVAQLRTLVDALTADLIQTQEEYSHLNTEFTRYRQATEDNLAALRDAAQLPSYRESSGDPREPAGLPSAQPQVPGRLQAVEPVSLSPSADEMANQMSQALHVAVSNRVLQPAVLLSPPQQSDSPRNKGHNKGASSRRLWEADDGDQGDRIGPRNLAKDYMSGGHAPSTPGAQVTQEDVLHMEEEHRQLQQQIEELNRQHAEAQGKLHSLMHTATDIQVSGDATAVPVSPPLSPISAIPQHAKGTNNQVRDAMRERVSRQGIVVSMPRVEELQMSATSTPSPKSTQSKSVNPSPIPIVDIVSPSTAQTPFTATVANNRVVEGGWFALSHHMAS